MFETLGPQNAQNYTDNKILCRKKKLNIENYMAYPSQGNVHCFLCRAVHINSFTYYSSDSTYLFFHSFVILVNIQCGFYSFYTIYLCNKKVSEMNDLSRLFPSEKKYQFSIQYFSRIACIEHKHCESI